MPHVAYCILQSSHFLGMAKWKCEDCGIQFATCGVPGEMTKATTVTARTVSSRQRHAHRLVASSCSSRSHTCSRLRTSQQPGRSRCAWQRDNGRSGGVVVSCLRAQGRGWLLPGIPTERPRHLGLGGAGCQTGQRRARVAGPPPPPQQRESSRQQQQREQAPHERTAVRIASSQQLGGGWATRRR